MQLRDRVALVTGAGTGIGRATAILFAREGAQVVLLGRTETTLAEVAREIDGLELPDGPPPGRRALVAVADVSVAEQMERAVAAGVEHFARLDIVFANAGINGMIAPVEQLTPEEWDQTLGVNLKGTFLTVKYAVPHLKRRGGSIVICSSVNGTRQFSLCGRSAYSASKAGQLAFGQMIALELARWKIRVNVICPGSVETEIGKRTWRRDVDKIRIPVKYPEGTKLLTEEATSPDQIARLVLFLSSDDAGHITGTPIWIDGGESLLIG